MTEYEQLHLEKRIEALMKFLGLCFVESECDAAICHEGRWPDGDWCSECGGLGVIFTIETVKEKRDRIDSKSELGS